MSRKHNNSMKSWAMSVCAVAVLSLGGCASMTVDPPKPVPPIAEQFKAPYYINALNIVIDNRYDPLSDNKDVSGTFPTSPDIAVKQYLEKRFQAAGPSGTFRFVIQDAAVFQKDVQTAPSSVQWMGVGKATEYKAIIRIGLYRNQSMGNMVGAPGSEIKAERTFTVPAGATLDQRDQFIQNFMARLLADIDMALTNSLTNTLMLSAPEPSPSPGAWPVGDVQVAPIIQE